METLGTDLRCIDAHAHLGNLVFDRSPEHAMVHYEIGIRIESCHCPWVRRASRLGANLQPAIPALPARLRAMRWRLGKLTEAQRVFERILSLNPNDNQGVRFCWEDCATGAAGKRCRNARCRRRGRLN